MSAKTEFRHTKEELKQLQSLPLEDKVELSKNLIRDWYEHWNGKVCVNFSGGKDSTVTLHLVRSLYPEVPAVYVDHGMDLNSVRGFVLRTPNVVMLKPEMDFRQVIEKYGWVYPSKDVAHRIAAARRGAPYALANLNGKSLDGTPSGYHKDRHMKWKYLLNAPFIISDRCGVITKHRPIDKFVKETGMKPYLGLLACESSRRALRWLRDGANAVDNKKATSCPLAVWTEQDILRYIKTEGIEISAAYGEIVEKQGKLKTTGEQRTGCIYCLIGAHLDNPNRIQRLKELEPERYKFAMEELGLKEVMDWLKLPY